MNKANCDDQNGVLSPTTRMYKESPYDAEVPATILKKMSTVIERGPKNNEKFDDAVSMNDSTEEDDFNLDGPYNLATWDMLNSNLKTNFQKYTDRLIDENQKDIFTSAEELVKIQNLDVMSFQS